MRAQVGFAEANHDNPVQTTLLFDALNIDGYSYDYRANSRLPLITYGTTDVTNPATWTLSQIRLRPQSTINSYQTAALDFEWAASDAFSLKFGPQWKNYIFKSTEARRSNGTTANMEGDSVRVTAPIAELQLPHPLRQRPGHAGRQRHDLAHPGSDRRGRRARPEQRQPLPDGHRSRCSATTTRSKKTTWARTSRVTSAFELGARTLRGNVGVRYVETDMTSHGLCAVAGVPDRAGGHA